MRITEYVGPEGIISSRYDHRRAGTPKPGDLIDNGDDTYGMIESVDDLYQTGIKHAHIVRTTGRAFLSIAEGKPYVSISGGPFYHIELSKLIGTYKLGTAHFWNWGDNLAGADMGCDYMLTRPVFRLRHESGRHTIKPN